MPIYEFYCPDCHCLYNFFSRRVNVEKRPDCPRCGRPALERRASMFAISRGRSAPEEGGAQIDDARLEQALGELAAEAGAVSEEDPRQMGRLVRRLYEATGLRLGPGMDEAIRRMEAGEDPERIEEQLGDVLESEDPDETTGRTREVGERLRRLLPPRVDETLHDL